MLFKQDRGMIFVLMICTCYVDQYDHVVLCIKCVGKTGKNHFSEVFEDKLQFLWKSHSSICPKYSRAPSSNFRITLLAHLYEGGGGGFIP